MDGQVLSLGEVAFSFLSSLSSEEGKDRQQEVNRFILWYGKERPIDQITPVEVASYAQWVGSYSDATRRLEPVKAFLAYAKREGFVKANLASQLRVKPTLPKTPLMSRPKRRVTLAAEDYAEMKSKLAALEDERGRIAEELRKAAADKDFRENAPLQAAREQRDQIEAQMRELRAALSATAVEEEEAAEELVVRLRSRVILRTPSGEKLTYTLVPKSQTNPAENKISIASPIGKALLNQHQGDVVKVIAPVGELCYQIERIEFQY